MKLGKLGLAMGLASLVACSESSVTGPEPEPQNPTEQNTPPTINSSPLTLCNENSLYVYEINASDRDFDNLRYSLTKKPSWLSINGNLVSGRCPEVIKDEVSGIEINVSDGKDSKTQSYALTVKNLFNAYTVSTTGANPLVAASENSLAFTNPTPFMTGDILATGVNNITPYGALRKVISTSSDKKVVNTTKAPLEEVVREGRFFVTGTLSQTNLQNFSPSLEGVFLRSDLTSSSQGFGLNLTNVVLYDFDGNPTTTGDQFRLNGRIELGTDFNFSADFNGVKLKDLDFNNKSTIMADLTVGYNTSIGLASMQEVALGEYYFSPITVPSPLGGLPIVVIPKIGVYAGINPTKLNPLSLRVKQESELELGLKYNGSWTPTANFTDSLEFSNSLITGEWDLGVYVTPRLTFLFGGFLGASSGISAGLRLESNSENWGLYGNLSAILGLSMEIFGKNISAYYKQILNYETLLAQGQVDPGIDSTFTDSRDGHVYKLVKLGTQTWMAENLDYNSSGSEYYNNNSSYGDFYGRLHSFTGSKTACPTNWHLPTTGEWNTLFTFLGGISSSTTGGKLKATGIREEGTGLWYGPNTGATNESKFSAQPGGMKDALIYPYYTGEGAYAYFWANTSPYAQAYSLAFNSATAGDYVVADNPEGLKFSIRCVKN